MRRRLIRRIVGLQLTCFALVLLLPLAISLALDDGAHAAFVRAFALVGLTGLGLWWPVRGAAGELKLRDGFLVVVLFWLAVGGAGALPFMLGEAPGLDTIDALFEATSGLTTTGASVLTGLDGVPPSVLFYRQLLQWLGGMAVIVLAVAVQPLLGVGGMQFTRAGAPGPVKDARLTPRITETARALSYVYLALTAACALAYAAAGMSLFDAVAHSFSTVALGGFTLHDESLGWYDSAAVEAVAIVFMLLAGINFSLHFLAWRHRNLKPYIHDAELRMYVGLLLVATLACLPGVLLAGIATTPHEGLRQALFHAVSIGTTAGFTTTSLHLWPGYLPLLLLFLSCIGGCAGSTAGGLKVIRCLLLYKQGLREVRRLIHPNAVVAIRLGDRPVDARVVDAVWGFFATYVAVFVLLLLGVMASGMDQVSAFSAVAACLNNLGPGLGEVGANYAGVTDFTKLLLAFAMLLGRLEIFVLLVLFTPTFWRA
jgi:trk system potassium uptake protein